MKRIIFLIVLLFSAVGFSRAQTPIVDKHPNASIYIIDPQSGQEAEATDDAAIAFKDAFVDLVINTSHAKLTIKSPGKKSFVITQADPSNGNAFQLTQQSKIFGQQVTNYTFSYNVDQNTLYYYDQVSQDWVPELIQGMNVVNLNNCLALGKFNEIQPADNANTGDAQQADDADDDNITADAAPPELQDYDQPECPEDGYLWQPGYWAYNPGGGYYWVAGAWVAPPSAELLWTPPYWGYEGSHYIFHAGYWGPEIGFYGGVDYGYGYGGVGFVGGSWYGGHFRYNTAVVHVGHRVRNIYVDRTVVRVGVRVKVSFNGGNGTRARPTERELKVNNEKHIRDHSQNPKAVKVNHGNNGNDGGRNGSRPGNGHNGPGNANNNANNGNGPHGPKGPGGNGPRGPGAGGNSPGVPKVPGSGPRGANGGNNSGVPKVPGNGPGRSGNKQGGDNDSKPGKGGGKVKADKPAKGNKKKDKGDGH